MTLSTDLDKMKIINISGIYGKFQTAFELEVSIGLPESKRMFSDIHLTI